MPVRQPSWPRHVRAVIERRAGTSEFRTAGARSIGGTSREFVRRIH
jgi:hypothetical protein